MYFTANSSVRIHKLKHEFGLVPYDRCANCVLSGFLMHQYIFFHYACFELVDENNFVCMFVDLLRLFFNTENSTFVSIEIFYKGSINYVIENIEKIFKFFFTK
jgi:hypothetical protein